MLSNYTLDNRRSRYISEVRAQARQEEYEAIQEAKKIFIEEVADSTQDNTIKLNDRITIFNEKQKEWENNEWKGRLVINYTCPKKFGPFEVSQWGGTGECGFDIWFDENGKREKRWINLNIIYNTVTDVRNGWSRDELRFSEINKLKNSKKTPDCLFQIFPQGYYLSENSTELILPSSAVEQVYPDEQSPDEQSPDEQSTVEQSAVEQSADEQSDVEQNPDEENPDEQSPGPPLGGGIYRNRTYRIKNNSRKKYRKSNKSKKHSKSKKSKKYSKSKRSKKHKKRYTQQKRT